MSLWTLRKKIKAWTSIFPSANNNSSFKTRDMSSKTAPYPCALSSTYTLASTSTFPCGYWLCWHHCTRWKAGQAPHSKNSVSSSFHLTKEQFLRSIVFNHTEIPWKNTTVGCLWEGRRATLSTVSELRANNPANEMFGGLDQKPTD